MENGCASVWAGKSFEIQSTGKTVKFPRKLFFKYLLKMQPGVSLQNPVQRADFSKLPLNAEEKRMAIWKTLKAGKLLIFTIEMWEDTIILSSRSTFIVYMLDEQIFLHDEGTLFQRWIHKIINRLKNSSAIGHILTLTTCDHKSYSRISHRLVEYWMANITKRLKQNRYCSALIRAVWCHRALAAASISS